MTDSGNETIRLDKIQTADGERQTHHSADCDDVAPTTSPKRLRARRDHPMQSTLAWGRQYLPHHFVKPASAMHVWLGDQLDRSSTCRGSKVNLIGPRGSAK